MLPAPEAQGSRVPAVDLSPRGWLTPPPGVDLQGLSVFHCPSMDARFLPHDDLPTPSPYEPPTLVELGTLLDLTAAGSFIDPT